jgi:hypothetical protein
LFAGKENVADPWRSFFMNLVELKPGEAMYVAEDGLHAWLDGQIIELMANSYVSPFSSSSHPTDLSRGTVTTS